MFKDALKAELYKQYSNKGNYILPVILFIAFYITTFYVCKVFSTYTPGELFELLDMALLYIVLVIMIYFVVLVFPIIISIVVFGYDFDNKVIANTIASGVSRNNIYWLKVITIVSYFLVILSSISIAMIFAALMNQLFYPDTVFVDLLKELELELFFGNLTVSIFTLIMSAALSLSISIAAIILTKNFVSAFFTVIGLNVLTSIVMGYFSILILGLHIPDTASLVIVVILNILAIVVYTLIWYFRFNVSEY